MEKQLSQILIVDDDPNLIGSMSDILRLKGFEPVTALTGASALASIEQRRFHAALIDLRLGDASGLEVLRDIKLRAPQVECILLTGHASQNSAIEAIQLGAFGYFQKPFDVEQVLLSIQRAVEKNRTGEALRESEARFHALIQNAADLIVVVDSEGVILYASPSSKRILGYTEEEFLGRKFHEWVHPEDMPLAIESLMSRRRIAGTADESIEMRGLHKNGAWRVMEVLGTNLLSEPSVGGIVMNIRDVTERKYAEEAQYNSEQRYRGLFEDTPIGIWEEDFSEVKKYLDSLKQQGVTNFRKYFEAHPDIVAECYAAIKIVDVNNTAVQMFKAESKEVLINFTDSQVLSKAELENFNNSLIAVAEGETHHTRESADKTLTGEPIEISLRWSVVPGHEADYSRVIVTTLDITERKKAEESLRANEERYRLLFENAPVGIFSADLHGKIIEVNSLVLQIMGSPSVEATKAINLLTFPPLVDAGFSADFIRCTESGQPVFAECSYNSKWGKAIFAQYRLTPIHDSSGNVSQIQTILEDITERKLAEDTLRASEKRYHDLFEDSPVALLEEDFSAVKQLLDTLRQEGVADIHTHLDHHPEIVVECAKMVKIKDVNQTALKMYRADVKANMPIDLSEILRGGAIENFKDQLANIADGQIKFNWTGINHAIDGSQIDVEVNWSASPGYEKDLSKVIVALQDITERKQAEDALRKSEALLSEAQRIGQVGYWEWSSPGRNLVCSDNLLRILDLPLDTNPITQGSLSSLVHPDDLPRIKALDHEILSMHADMDYEYRVILSGGRLRWLHQQAKITYGEDGQPIRMIGIMQDITGRKQAEAALFESEEKYRLLVDQSPYAISIHQHGKLVFVNAAALSLVGAHSADELIGRPVSTIVHPDAWEAARERILRMMQGETGLYPVEDRYIRLDGSVIPVEVNAAPFTFKGQTAIQIIAVDITERKRSEEQLLLQSSALNAAANAIVITDVDGTIRWANPAFGVLTGYSLAEAIGKNPRDLLKSGKQDSAFYKNMWETILSGNVWHGEIINCRKDGSHYTEELTITPLKDAEGQIKHFIAVKQDITGRKLAEQTLRDKERSLRESQIIAGLGSYVFDIQLGMWTSSEILDRIFGIDEGYVRSVEGWQMLIHPDFRQDMSNYLAQEILGKYLRFDREYKIVRQSDGVERWVRGLGELELNDQNQPVKLYGTIQDITGQKRTEDAIRQRVAELELIYESGLVFSQLLDPKEIAQKVIYLLEQKMNWHHTAIRLYDPQTDMLQLLAYNQPDLDSVEDTAKTEERIKARIAQPSQGLSGWVVQHGQTVRSNNLANDPHYLETIPGMKSGLYTPIKLGDRVIGVISIESEQPDAFNDASERLTNTLANQAASAFENARLFNETNQRIVELTTLHRTGQTLLAARLNPEQIFAAAHQAVSQTMSCDAFVIVLDDNERGEYQAVYFFDKGERFPARWLPRGKGLSGRVITSGETLLIDDTINLKLEVTHFGSMESTRSILAVPLRRGNEVVGMLSTQSYQPHDYGEPQQVLLETITAQLSSALDNANLYQQTQLRIKELETLHIISTSLRAIQTIDVALSTLLDNTLAALETDAGEILLYDLPGDELRSVVTRGWFAEMSNVPIKAGEGVAGTVFASGESYYSVEFARDSLPHASTRNQIPSGWGGVCLPIHTSTEVIGVMFVSVQLPRKINSQQMRLLESLVDMAGAALHRMRLHNETARRAEEFASLYDMSRALSAEYDLDSLLAVIVDRAKTLLRASTSGMYLYHAESQELELSMDTSPTIPLGSRLKIGEGVAGTVAQTRQPLRIDDYEVWDGRSPKFAHLPIHAVIEVPMLYAGELIGVLTADETGDSGRKFTEADEHLLSLFASQAAGAINSARHHKDTIRYAEELEQRVRERTAEIEATRQRLDLATKAGGIGVWEVNLKENKILWDMRMHIIHGTDPEDFDNLLTTWWQMVHPEDLEQSQKRFKDALEKTGVFIDEHRIVRPDGSLRHIAANAVVISDAYDIPERIVGVNIDVTERKHAEATLQHANLEMERAMRTKDEFLANMSHELRTPLNSILGISESLEEQIIGSLNPKQLRYIGIVKESGRHLLELINDILDISKIEAGRMELDLQNISVEKICQSSLRMIKELAQKKSLKVSFEIIGPVEVVLGDERRLKQSLVNLLSNAVKFTPADSYIGLEVKGHPQDNEVSFTVWDKGVGIAEEDIKFLFKPFVQLDSGLAREYQGTGLGLALVNQMIHLHGGRVDLESRLGEGSRFTITLPWLPEQQKAQVKNTTELKRPMPRLEKKRNAKILLVEDTEVIISLMTEYLEYKGYQVLIAHNGMEGFLLAREEHPDLILMDIMMPVMDGLEATKNIREIEDLKNTPIVALTALAMSGDRERCFAAGMNDYLSKPIRIQELADVVERYLINKGQPPNDQ